MSTPMKATMTPSDLSAVYQALDRVQALIEFDLEGIVVAANENFLKIFGYELEEVVGKHHRMFCDPDYADSDEYAEFWKKLGAGEFNCAEFKRFGKGTKLLIAVDPGTVLQARGPGKDAGNRVRAGFFSLLMLAIVARDRAVRGFRLDGLAVRRHQHAGHQAE